MRRMFMAFPLAVLTLIGWPTTDATAQDTRTARGTVSAIGADFVTVKVRDADMKFNVDMKTTVEAVGGSTATRRAAEASKPGVKVSDLLQAGQAVEVTYHDMSGTLHANRIRRIASAAAGAGSTSADKPSEQTSTGTVKSVAATSLAIEGSGGGGSTFTQTLVIDANTKVVGVGAGSASAAAGGKVALTALVGPGDRVSVSFHQSGANLVADDVRVTTKARR